MLALEGTRSYGIGLSRAAQDAGLTVLEAERPRWSDGRRGKSDPIDAHLAAVHVLRLPVHRLATPRADGDREALRILLGARRELTTARTRHVNRLRALLLAGDDGDRDLARGALSDARLATLARRRGPGYETSEQAVRRGEVKRLATAIRLARNDLARSRRQLLELVEAIAPRLLEHVGIGPIRAAQAIVSWSHPGRCRSDAAFASLAGAAPLPASSGRIVRHRLNRSGDRALNRALHDIVLTRWRVCARTHDYVQRRRAQGKSDGEIRRNLRRYIAREIYRTLEATAA